MAAKNIEASSDDRLTIPQFTEHDYIGKLGIN